MNAHDRPDNGKWVDVESRYLSLDESAEFAYKAPLEEPLRISITHLGKTNELGIFMRSPGNDLNLVRGLIYNEGIISELDSIDTLTDAPRGGSTAFADTEDPAEALKNRI